MERADEIDSYFKKNLENETHVPSVYARLELFEQLENQAKLKKRSAWYKRLALFIIVLLLGSQFTNDTNPISIPHFNNTTEELLLATAKAQNTATEIQDWPISSKTNESATERDTEENKQNDALESLSAIHEDISLSDDGLTAHGDLSVVKVEIAPLTQNFQKVTESEIDSLIQLAEYTLLQQEASFMAQKAYAMKMLDEIEHETQLKPKKGFGQHIKQGFKKFKTIIAN
ncbi:hypothetical protein [Allomuricauda sp. d1]|uniref:hypothetical protein n=1 Tax=Allomuricauda sp. d1 TaxID=3136725 RepID=UPI0031D69168